MRLILIDNLLYEDLYTVPKYDLQPHLGLLSLVSVARAAGHEAEIYDPKLDLVRGVLRLHAALYREMAERILARNPDVVGFTALGCNFNCVAKVAAQIKLLQPGMPVLLGGPHATILHREILERFPSFDLIARNEAEQTLPPLLEQLEDKDFEGLVGVSYRSHLGRVVCNPGSPIIEELDSLPVPAYDSYPLAELELSTIRVEAGRGCPFSCTFCSTASFFGRSFRLKSADRLLAEMDYLHQAYGFTDFKLNHDLFTVNRKKVVQFCEAMLGRSYTWGCSARVDCVDADLLELMWRAGCRGIYFGIESGSERMQAVSRKRLDLTLVEPTVDVTTRLGMTTITSFITGYPEECADDQEKTLDMAGRLFCRPDELTVSQLHLLTPEPGTQLMVEYGHRLDFDGHVTDFNFPQLEPDDKEILRNNPDIFGNHHYFPSELPRHRHIFVTSIWNSLRIAGRIPLDYSLRAFSGRLSRLIDEAFGWYCRTQPTLWAVNIDHLIAFFSERFGSRHHLVSVFRYAAAVRVLRESTGRPRMEPPGTTCGDPRNVLLEIPRTVRILRAVHDCVSLFEMASGIKDRLLDDEEVGPLHDLLLIRNARLGKHKMTRDTEVATYVIDTVTADMLDQFVQPKSYWRFCSEVAQFDDAPFAVWEDIEQLCRKGVLQPVSLTEVSLVAAE